MMSSDFDTILVYSFAMTDEDRYIRITLRIPRELHAQLTDAAEATSKSMNAEIVARLVGSFEAEAGQGIDEERLERIVEEAVGRALRRQERD